MVSLHGRSSAPNRSLEWQAQENNRLPTPQPPCYQRNTSHPVILPPGEVDPSREEENSLQRMEWVTTVYHSTLTTDTIPLHHPLGPLQIPHGSSRIEDTMKSPLPSPTKPNVWTIPYYGLTQSKRASSKLQTQNHSQPGEISLCSRQDCRLRNHQ